MVYRQGGCPGSKCLQEYFAHHQAAALDLEAAAAPPGARRLVLRQREIIAVTGDQGQLKGAAVHARVPEQYCPQGFVPQATKMTQRASQEIRAESVHAAEIIIDELARTDTTTETQQLINRYRELVKPGIYRKLAGKWKKYQEQNN